MRKRARQPKPEMLGNILQKILKKRRLPHAGTDRRLLDIWRRTVGPRIAAQTYPDSLKQGTLFVRVSAPVWMHQLQFLKEEIIVKINELAGSGSVKGLFFSVGEIPALPSDATDRQPADPIPADLRGRDRKMIRESLDAIRDSELREIMERVMTREISRRRQREKRQGP